MRRLCLILEIIVILLAAATPVASASTARFALVAGNNRGQQRQRALRYAHSDAQRFAALLCDLGDFEPENVVLLTGASRADFEAGFSKLDQRIRQVVPAEAPRAMLVVYFSGHSDGVRLELGDELLPFAGLKQLVEESAADVKIVFIDSCKSGGLTAYKGGRPGPGFDLVLTDRLEADGTAIVTSSAAGENAQESGELRGSFYTHYLISGLRGAADRDTDGKVTLAEVYEYAYDKTVVETSRTLGGTQHPTYDYKISGRGKVVLTDLGQGQAHLTFGPDSRGKFLVLREDSEEVVAEISKPFGIRRHLALRSGRYLVAWRKNGRLYSQQMQLAVGETARVDPAAMREEASLVASVKAGAPGRSRWGVFVHYGLLSGALKNFAAVHQGVVGLKVDIGPLSVFPRFGYGVASIEDGRLRYDMRLYALETYTAWRFEYSVLDLFAGINLGVSYGAQSLPDGEDFAGSVFSYGAVGGLDLPLWAGLALQVFWEAGGMVFKLDGNLEHQLLLKGVIGLGYQF